MYLTFAQFATLPAGTVLTSTDADATEYTWVAQSNNGQMTCGVVWENAEIKAYGMDFFIGHTWHLTDADGFIVPRSAFAK